MAQTHISRPGSDQAVRDPQELRPGGSEAEICRRDGEPAPREVQDQGLSAAFALLTELPPEIDRRDDPWPQERVGDVTPRACRD